MFGPVLVTQNSSRSPTAPPVGTETDRLVLRILALVELTKAIAIGQSWTISGSVTATPRNDSQDNDNQTHERQQDPYP